MHMPRNKQQLPRAKVNNPIGRGLLNQSRVFPSKNNHMTACCKYYYVLCISTGQCSIIIVELLHYYIGGIPRVNSHVDPLAS